LDAVSVTSVRAYAVEDSGFVPGGGSSAAAAVRYYLNQMGA